MKIKIKKYMYTFSFFITTILLLYSCEDYLDIPYEGSTPEGYIDEPTPDEAFQFVSAAYASLRNWGVSVFPYIGIFEITSDDADKGSTPDDAPDMIALNNFSVSPNNVLVESFWNDNYSAISNCNYAINKLESLAFEDIQLQRQLIGEAKFLRAFIYLHLNLAFGGVPLVDTTLSAEEFAKIPRSSTGDVYIFIDSDLTYAVEHLPETYEFQWLGRATKGAARALLARSSMYQGKWDVVKTQTDDIIASGLYSLYPNFYKLFRVAGENSSESIFELQLASIDQGKYRCEYGFVQGPRNNFARLQGWGFNIPSEKLIAFFESRNDSIRKNATVLRRGSRTPEGDSIDANVPNPVYNFKVYTQKKYNNIDYALDHNIRFIRYAEVLLMNAEAAIQAGGDAATPLNEVRSRVGLADISSPTLQDVWDERRAELAMEEFRFFDLVRTGRASEELASLGFVPGKNEVFPIPQTQIDLSNGVLQQNPGY